MKRLKKFTAMVILGGMTAAGSNVLGCSAEGPIECVVSKKVTEGSFYSAVKDGTELELEEIPSNVTIGWGNLAVGLTAAAVMVITAVASNADRIISFLKEKTSGAGE